MALDHLKLSRQSEPMPPENGAGDQIGWVAWFKSRKTQGITLAMLGCFVVLLLLAWFFTRKRYKKKMADKEAAE